VLLGAGVAIVTLAFMRLRSAIAFRDGVIARHYPWIPAVLVGGTVALVGIGFAPMPATKGEGGVPNRARWLGTGLIGALAVTLLLIGRFSGVPFATGWRDHHDDCIGARADRATTALCGSDVESRS
jgi:hypothetical protein